MSSRETFKAIVKSTSTFFKSVPDEAYLDRFASKAFEYCGGYEDKLKDALRICVDTQSVFPSVADFQRAVESLQKKPLDYIASMQPDARTVRGCHLCEFRGWVECQSWEGYTAVCRCPSCDGKNLTTSLPSSTEAETKGYKIIKTKGWRKRA